MAPAKVSATGTVSNPKPPAITGSGAVRQAPARIAAS